MPHPHRVVALALCTALIAGLVWLDQNRAGPANAMARCNLLLSRSSEPAADVLVLGSSRTGVAIDPVGMERTLTMELARPIRVERLSLGSNPLRAMNALLENYLEARGPPRIVVLEIMFMTERSVKLLAGRGLAITPEDYLYRRDVNVLDFEQLLTQPSVSMPFTTPESRLNLWSQRLRGVVLRSGALIYQALREPTQEWNLSVCSHEDWTREATWPPDFAFSYGDLEPETETRLKNFIETLETRVARNAKGHELKEWQTDSPQGRVYPYDFDAAYRQGEIATLTTIIERAVNHDAEVILLPLPTYGYELDHTKLHDFVSRFAQRVQLFDLYGAIRVDFEPLWYNDAHVERATVGALTTALMAQRLVRSQALQALRSESDG